MKNRKRIDWKQVGNAALLATDTVLILWALTHLGAARDAGETTSALVWVFFLVVLAWHFINTLERLFTRMVMQEIEAEDYKENFPDEN